AFADLSADDLLMLQNNLDKLSPDERLELRGILNRKQKGCRTNRWISKIRPNLHPKQKLFLSLEDREVLYGGSAGCGKSDALLLSAMQYVDVPDYSAIILRRTLVDLNQSGALMDRAKAWFTNTEAKYSAAERSWYFPTGRGRRPARLTFAYLQDEGDIYNYQGAEFQFVAYDELTQHSFRSYSYLFSRLRRLKDSLVPIRMRSATNPGGKFAEWVKENFITDDYLNASPYEQSNGVWTKQTTCGECHATGRFEDQQCVYCEGAGHRTRYFVPARLMDNPSIDLAEYSRSLIELPPVERYRLEHGDWSITEQGNLFHMESLRFYTRSGDHFKLTRPGQSDLLINLRDLQLFITADTASLEKTTADFTAISTWAFHQRSGSLILIGCQMSRMEVPKIAPAIINQSANDKATFTMVEHAQCGIGVIQELRGIKGNGMAVLDYMPGKRDKIARSTTAQIKVDAGQVYFPAGRPGWLDACLAQLIGFPNFSHDDFVDTLTMAASWAHSRHQSGNSGEPAILAPIGR
ncbi:MAG: phage terminase large subunit, partial [Planctomycetota bacterium]